MHTGKVCGRGFQPQRTGATSNAPVTIQATRKLSCDRALAMNASRDQVIIVTGAAGFLGSALTVDLARRHTVIAVDRREPSQALLDATKSVAWRRVDIGDERSLAAVFAETRQRLGRIDFILHFAAFYHFGTDRHPEYQRTNVQGTSTVLRLAIENGAGRLIFASSMVAMLPPPPGEMLTERSPTSAYIPYGESKCVGEQLAKDASDRLPAVVLRIGGVFSDWCELPPLASVIKLWAGRSPLSRVVVGRGNTGIPYLHRDDLVLLVNSCIDQNEAMAPYELFLASEHGAVSHTELFRITREACADGSSVQPILLSPAIATVGLVARRAWGLLTRDPPYERPWMFRYIARPWIADTTYTRNKLQWDCTDPLTIRQRLPLMLHRFWRHRRVWEQRNRAANRATYSYLD
jgi:nucleoside-diphosphate-sugar epimerase